MTSIDASFIIHITMNKQVSTYYVGRRYIQLQISAIGHIGIGKLFCPAYD